ncbi:hypothetical protein OZD68_05240 [Wolbachia endosymbiont of Drosophila bicornuta]|uniref:hypothetical protein n=1 Tax=Wolbachia TaxID=953 RepID=UPI0015F8FB4E|nr:MULTISPECIES: hypothetical protein [Wolbachia]MBA8755452.1 hypothetical protein [Wolbachia pipientis]MDE5056968.1 hypothetical protein [Wolbachia endosymbiont of Drosophila bicornuta]
MLLACYSHKHISYRIRTIIRKAIHLTMFELLDLSLTSEILLFSLHEDELLDILPKLKSFL